MQVLRKIRKKLKKAAPNDWTDQTVVVFGDSIVAGQELIREQTPYRDIVYAKVASRYLNARVLHNFAETGTGQFKGQLNLDRKTGWVHNFENSIKRYLPEVKQADVVIIAYGNNDWKQPNSDGSIHSIEEVKQKLRDNINQIRQINRHVQIVGILETVAFRQHKLAWLVKGPNEFTYQDMIEAYISVYKEMGVAIFDIRDYHIGNSIREYIDDRDHFTKVIHSLIGEALVDFVKHDYQSPVDQYGQPTKVILEQGIDDFLQHIDMNTEAFRTFTDGHHKIEILYGENGVDRQQQIDELKQTNAAFKPIMFTNMYDYWKDYYNNRAFTNPPTTNASRECLDNSGNAAYLKYEENGYISISNGAGEWYPAMSTDQLTQEWLKQYISTKDEVWGFKEGVLRPISVFDIQNP